MDSGQESDTADQSVDRSGGKRGGGGILRNFKKMFKMKRKSKTGKISERDNDDHDGKFNKCITVNKWLSSLNIYFCILGMTSNQKLMYPGKSVLLGL